MKAADRKPPVLAVDPVERQVTVNNRPVKLTRTEYQLIEDLSITPHTGVSYREIAVRLSTLRGPVTSCQVKATARSTRRKLRAAGFPNPVPEVAGIGLKLA